MSMVQCGDCDQIFSSDNDPDCFIEKHGPFSITTLVRCESCREDWVDDPAQGEEIRIVFDGPPGHKSGRFVEVENVDGHSIRVGVWHKRDDELWELRIPNVGRR